MTTKDVKAAHATRMRFFKDKSLNMTEELKQAAEHNDHQLYVAAKILEVPYNEEEMKYEVLVAWRGFPVGDAAWEPYNVMEIDVPEMVCKFLDSHKVDEARARRRMQSGISFSLGQSQASTCTIH
jgi:hypothetical protein